MATHAAYPQETTIPLVTLLSGVTCPRKLVRPRAVRRIRATLTWLVTGKLYNTRTLIHNRMRVLSFIRAEAAQLLASLLSCPKAQSGGLAEMFHACFFLLI